MPVRQQRGGLYVVGEWRTHAGMIVLLATDKNRRETFQAAEFKTFRSRQAAARWRDYRPMQLWNHGAADHLAVIALPVPQDD